MGWLNIMIFDTSVWVDYLKGNINPKSMLLKEYFDTNLSIYTCPCIIQEVLQGSKSASQFLFLKDLISGLNILKQDEFEMSVFAAQIYFQLRKKGITLRKPNDCLIAAYAINSNITLVHNDRDFDEIAKVFPLKIFNPE
ncbi:MAG: PIN domain-containing protein [Bacteroidota bacterium]|nr:PIN domain-containing protein [Bacteroidota bacterium]